MMKKRLVSIIGAALAAVSLGVVAAPNASATVANPIVIGKTLNLTRGAAIFDRNGVKVGHIRKGKSYKVRAIKTINGDTYVKIGKNKFVKEEAFLPYVKSGIKAIHRIKAHSFIYDENGRKIPGKFIKRGTKIPNLGHKEINEKPFIKIGNGKYVKALNVLTTVKNY